MDGVRTPSGRVVRLSERELEVVGLLSHGLTRRQIGAVLFLSENTVKTHVRRVSERLGASNATHVVALCLRSGVLG